MRNHFRRHLLCFLNRFDKLSRDEDPVEVSSLSRPVILRLLLPAQPVSGPLQVGVRFFHHPLPAGLWVCLAAFRPRLVRAEEPYGLTMFRLNDNDGLGAPYSPIAFDCPCQGIGRVLQPRYD